MKSKKLSKCPRCNLPQEGIYSCEYCGYVFSKNEKKIAKAYRKKVKDFIGALNKDPIVQSKKKGSLQDNGGTRSGTDRRKYTFRTYSPESRSGRDRRKGIDRRRKVPRKRWAERRFSLNHEMPYPRKM